MSRAMTLRLPHHRQLWQIAADLLLINLSMLMAMSIRFTPDPIPWECWRLYSTTALPFSILQILCFWRLRLYRIAWRYVGLHDLTSVAKGVTLSSVLFVAGLSAMGGQQYPRSVLILDWLLTCFLVGGLRISLRAGTVLRAGLQAQRGEPRRRLLIVGAGDHGEALAREVGRHPILHYRLVGFLDDDEAKEGLLIHGAPVLGPISTIEAVVRAHRVQDVIIAIPSATGSQIRRILALCEQLPIRLRTTPGFSVLHTPDEARGAPVRDVSPEDLLRRAPVKADLRSIAGYLQGERVLITGAGGSIGAELVRQVLRFEPQQLLLLGRGENSIFEIEQELSTTDRARVVPLIADLRDRERMEQILAHYQPRVIFHAAAHKHVPLMEANPAEAIKNNVLGTRNLLELASAYRANRFVFISTDKAVNPTSVMGASKRIAEMLLQAQAQISPETRFMAVRFGNVLGSRGSVVQTMRRQIVRRQPVTVTHPEMVRYFMTIPEAVQLVIQAGALGSRGEIFVLDMGDPVPILELARDLIRLSGFVPGEEIPIEFIGIRPGEKLYEEVLTAQEGTTATQHARILIAQSTKLDPDALYRGVDRLITLAREGRVEEVETMIAELVPDFQRSRAPALPRPASPDQVQPGRRDSVVAGSPLVSPEILPPVARPAALTPPYPQSDTASA
jgi:FlaA1/EpsC-like NDP-sugar epimerase